MYKIIYFLFFLFTSSALFSQLGSSPWNPPTANTTVDIEREGKVGIGGETPEAMLHIALIKSGIIQVNDPSDKPVYINNTPHIRLRTSFLPIGIRTWDIIAGNDLRFKTSNANPATTDEVMTLNSIGLKVYGPRVAIGLDEKQVNVGYSGGHYLAFGYKPFGGPIFKSTTAGSGAGSILFADAEGNMKIITTDNAGNGFIALDENIRFTITNQGKVAIGTEDMPSSLDNNAVDISAYKLFVEGGILTKEVRVRETWSDYVFDTDYDLLPLQEVEEHIQEYGYLHNTPSGESIERGGLNLGEATANQQEKIEEIYLHLIAMDKKIKALEIKNQGLKTIIQTLKIKTDEK